MATAKLSGKKSLNRDTSEITRVIHWDSNQILPIHGVLYNFVLLCVLLLVKLWLKFLCCLNWQYKRSAEGSSEKLEAHKNLVDVMSHRLHVDQSVELIGNLLFGAKEGSNILSAVRASGMPLVDDWSCLKSMVSHLSCHLVPVSI